MTSPDLTPVGPDRGLNRLAPYRGSAAAASAPLPFVLPSATTSLADAARTKFLWQNAATKQVGSIWTAVGSRSPASFGQQSKEFSGVTVAAATAIVCGAAAASIPLRRRRRKQPCNVRIQLLPSPATAETEAPVAKIHETSVHGKMDPPADTLVEVAKVELPPSMADPEVDILQFDSAIYYVEEEEQELALDVVRLGEFKDRIQVSYYTEDSSGKAGERYEAVQGTLTFEPGELVQAIRVPIIGGDDWNTTLEFKVHLHEPVGCELGRYLFVCRVKVIDNDCFPTNRFAEEIEQFGAGNLVSNGVSEIDLIVEYCKFNFGLPGIEWRTWASAAIDLLQNLYYLLTIYLLKYVADDVLGPSPGLPLLVADSKTLTLLTVGALYVAPYGVLNALEYWKSQLETAERSQQFLQDNIFRRFTNYNEDSRGQVKQSEMGLAMVQDVPDIVDNGYMRLLEILKFVGRLGVSSYFIVAENPDCGLPLVIAGTTIVAYVSQNYRKSVAYEEAVSDRQAEIVEVVQEANQKIRLIADYYMRPQVQSVLEGRTRALTAATLPMRGAAVANDYFPGWISTALVAGYLGLGGSAVVEGELQIGAFLATINALKEIGDSFKDIFQSCLNVGKAIGPLTKVTELLNLPTSMKSMKKINRLRRRTTKELRRPEKLAELRRKAGTRYGSDAMPIMLHNLCFNYEGTKRDIIDSVNLEVNQGKLVAVVGPRRGGKSTFMKLLGHVLFPTEGSYFVPSYLRILHVSEDPMLLDRSLWSNLSVGSVYWRNAEQETARIIRICKRIGFSQAVVSQLEESKERFLAGEDDADDVSWQVPLSNSDRVLIQLARAFIYNAEVLVMHRPTVRLPESTSKLVIGLIKEFVQNKGVELPATDLWRRRPRTAFISFARLQGVQTADVVWKVDNKDVKEIEKANVGDDLLR